MKRAFYVLRIVACDGRNHVRQGTIGGTNEETLLRAIELAKAAPVVALVPGNPATLQLILRLSLLRTGARPPCPN